MVWKDRIAKMKEKDFQNEVLVPLFRAMKFKDVTVFGGGSLELGKDVVMWKEGDLGERVNYGVVVKAKRITGKARGRDTASEVLTQIRQCLTSEYADPVTARPQKTHRCFVVSSHIIEKTSIHSIASQLQDFYLEKVVSWIHPGTNLFQLLETHLPDRTTKETLAGLSEQLNKDLGIVPYRVVADTEGNIRLAETHPSAQKDFPLNLTIQFKDEFKEIGEWFLKVHFSTGIPVSIRGSCFSKFSLPDFVPPFLQPNTDEDVFHTFFSLEPNILLDFRSAEGSGENTVVEFESVRAGDDEQVIRSVKEKFPLEINIEFKSYAESIMNFKLDSFGKFPVQIQLRALKLAKLLVESKSYVISRFETGERLFVGGPPHDKFTEDILIEFLERMVVLSEKLGITLSYPGILTDSELESILLAGYIVTDGEIVPSKSKGKIFPLTVSCDEAKRVLLELEDKTTFTTTIEYSEYNMDILGQIVDLGKSFVSGSFRVTKTDIRSVKDALARNKKLINFNLVCDSDIFRTFPKWAKVDPQSI